MVKWLSFIYWYWYLSAQQQHLHCPCVIQSVNRCALLQNGCYLLSTSHIYREIFLPLVSRCARTINSVASSTWYIHCTLHNIYIYFLNQYLSIQKPGHVCTDNTYGFFVTLTLIFIIFKYINAHIYILMTVCICVCLSEELEIYSLKYFYMFWKTCNFCL